MASNLPAGMRNNNPGNIKYTPAIDWQGQLGPSVNLDQGDPQVVFATPQAGMRALAKNVLYKFNRGATTINQLIAGPDGWTPGYEPGAAGVADASGYAADQPINMNDPQVLGNVMRGIVTQEQGPASRLYSDQLIASGIDAAKGIPQYDAAGNPIQPQSAPQAQPKPLVTTTPATGNAVPLALSDDDLISKYLSPTTAANGNAAPAAPAPTGSAPDSDDALLQKYLGPSKPALPNVDATVGDRAADLRAATASAQPPELFPGSNAFQQAVMGSMPVIGSVVDNAVNSVGPRIASAISGQSADQTQQAAQKQEQQTAAQHPVATSIGNVVGSVLPFSAVGPEGAAAKLLGTAADYGQGAVGNALLRAGAGAASGAAISGADTLARGGSLNQAGQNALLGGTVGAVAPIALGQVGKGLGAAKNAFTGPSAQKMLSNALVADESAPADVNALLQQRGPGATVADLGPNTQGQAAGLASLPGKAQSIVVNNLKARAAQTGDRLAQDVAGTIGQGQPIGALTDQIVAGQKAAAAPLYQAVQSQPVSATPSLMSVLNTPIGKKAYAQAVEFAANDGVNAPATVEALQAAGSVPAGVLDYAKQALDDMTSAAQRGGENNAARQASTKASALVDEMDTQLGGAPGQGPYAQARAAFAGPAKVLDAIDMGQQVFSGKTSPEDLQTAMAGMSPSERAGLLAGAQAAVQKSIGNARTDAAGVKSLFDSANGKEKLAILVGQPQADQIANALERERAFSDTAGKVYRNSVTAANLAQQKVLSPELAGVPKQMAPQSSIGLLISGLEKARSAITGAYRNAQNAHLANMLTGGPLSPEDAATVMRASKPMNPLLALSPGVPSAAQHTGVPVPGLGSFVQPDRVFRDGRWIPRIYVRGATPLIQ